MFSLFKKPAVPTVPAVPEAPGLPARANGKYDVRLERGMPVRVHFNLHKGLWVIASRETYVNKKGKTVTGWVTVHNCDALTLTDCAARVSPTGAARIRKKQAREVCARIEGTLQSIDAAPVTRGARVAFNPYRADTFICDGAVWERGACVYFAKKRPEDKAPAGARCYEVN